MKLFTCSNCKQPLYFENNKCLNCGHATGFEADRMSLLTLSVGDKGILFDMNERANMYKYCENSLHGTCNWLIPSQQADPFCQACALNRTIPSLSGQENLTRWQRIEIAKHRLVYSLLRLHLPVTPKTEPEGEGIAFDFMADKSPEERVMTGHNKGTITLNIEEADEVERAKNKLDLGEKYRTLLGHFRHEIGHYYWDLLIKTDDGSQGGSRRESAGGSRSGSTGGSQNEVQRPRSGGSQGEPLIGSFRGVFGDERKDYAEALKAYYANGAPSDWAEHFISPYASSHPWEDWAETWSHYMHMMDTLETAYSFGIGIHPGNSQDLNAEIRRDPYVMKDFDLIFGMWLSLTFAVNSLNRSMGHADFYPFVISAAVREKLRFIHKTVQ